MKLDEQQKVTTRERATTDACTRLVHDSVHEVFEQRFAQWIREQIAAHIIDIVRADR